MVKYLNKIAPTLLNIVREAGRKVLFLYDKQNIYSRLKKDGSPVTAADELSHTFITQALHEISPYPILSEENPVGFSERKHWNIFWLIDPLDGTKDFLAHNGEFCINIALIKDRRPILGILFAPAIDELYYALKHEGAYLETNKKRVRLSFNTSSIPKVAISRFHESHEVLDFISLNQFKHVQKIGSALKFGRLAKKDVTVYPRFTGSSEWDIAAGDIILQEIGANIIDLQTKQFPLYNTPTLRNNFFIAHSKELTFSSFKLPSKFGFNSFKKG